MECFIDFYTCENGMMMLMMIRKNKQKRFSLGKRKAVR